MKKLTSSTTLVEALKIMADGNFGAMKCVENMIKYNCRTAFDDIIFLDELDIRGAKLYMLWNDCCGRDLKKLERTIKAFREKKFSLDEIERNLSQVRAKPFLTD